MAKEIEGWRRPREWDGDYKDNPMLTIITILTRSDDGWCCPHCEYKESLEGGGGIGNQEYFQLMEGYEPLEVTCFDCNKTYFLKATVVRKYFSCEDKEFKSE